MTLITATLTTSLNEFKTINDCNITNFSNGGFSNIFRLKLTDYQLSHGTTDCIGIGTKLNEIFKLHKLNADEKKNEYVKFLYELWKGGQILCDHHKGTESASCKCAKNIEELKNCITDYDDDNPGLYMEKVFVWILLNKKEWLLPKFYFSTWILFTIRPACRSIKIMLTNKKLNVNEMNDIGNNTSADQIYAMIICDILISGLVTELKPSHDRLGITDFKQVESRSSQNLNKWFVNTTTGTTQPLVKFLNKSILGEESGVPLLNNLVYGLLLDLWRKDINWDDWNTWISNTNVWILNGRKGTKSLEPVMRPVHKGEVLFCSTPETYTADDNTKKVSFYTRLTWPTQKCSLCRKDQKGGVLKDSLWFEGQRLKTITKTCVKLSSKNCSRCKTTVCTCVCCVPKMCERCLKLTSVTADTNINLPDDCRNCTCKICNKCEKCKKCECIDCTGCVDGTKCDCCKSIFFCSNERGNDRDLSQISILTDEKKTIPCKISHYHYPFAIGAGTGKKVFIDSEEFKNFYIEELKNVFRTKVSSNFIKNCQLFFVKCGFGPNEIDPCLFDITNDIYNDIKIIMDKSPLFCKANKAKIDNINKLIKNKDNLGKIILALGTLFNADVRADEFLDYFEDYDSD